MNVVAWLLGLLLLALFLFVCALAHPSPREPGLIRRIRADRTATGEYAAELAYGLFHPELLRTGATAEESRRVLPGDELVPKPLLQETRAITIDAPPDKVWPWIVQMGGGRAGWYWWTPMAAYPQYREAATSPWEILPQFQHLEVGDRLSDGGAATEERGNWIVKEIAANHHLVLYAARALTEGPDFDPAVHTPTGMWFVCDWSFALEPVDVDKTRMMVRLRAIGGPPWMMVLMRLVVVKGDRVAEMDMLRNIKARVEKKMNPQISQIEE